MGRVGFIFRTDVHVSETGPASWKGDYAAEIWSNLEQIGELAKVHRVNAVLDGGDYFHVKAASKNPHAIVTRTAKIHQGYPCPTFSIEGNHDIAYNNLESIGRQPLGVLYGTGVFSHLREQVFDDGNIRVRVVGVPYSPTRTLEDIQSIRKKPGDTFLVVIIHALAGMSPPAHVEEFFGEPVFRYRDLIVGDDGADVFCFGHWHRDQGIELVEGRLFVNQGALSRGALVKENLERIPKAALIEFTSEGPAIKPLPMNVLPASEVFDLERKERREQERKDIDAFIANLVSDPSFNSADSIEENIRNLDFANDVRDVALEYLSRARGEAHGEKY